MKGEKEINKKQHMQLACPPASPLVIDLDGGTIGMDFSHMHQRILCINLASVNIVEANSNVLKC
jgi:hypothetical protein